MRSPSPRRKAAKARRLTAINLAIVLARDVNSWVFLVDLDLQRPQMAPYLGMSFDKGLSDYLGGQASFDDIVYEIGVDRLAVIPNARPLEQSSELLGSPRMQELCRSLAAEVPRRIVIFDMPPLLLSDDVIKSMPNVDGLLFVVSEGRTQRATLQQAREIMPEDKLIGIMLNRSAEREKSGLLLSRRVPADVFSRELDDAVDLVFLDRARVREDDQLAEQPEREELQPRAPRAATTAAAPGGPASA